MAKQGFYAVRVGRSTGIFNTWDECKERVHKYNGSEFKKFPTLQEAQAFMQRTTPTEVPTVVRVPSVKIVPQKNQQPYYTVAEGHQPGVYDNWDKAEKSIKGYEDSVFQKFDSEEEAEEGLRNFNQEDAGTTSRKLELVKDTGTKGAVRDRPDIERRLKEHKSKGPVYAIVHPSGKTNIVATWLECAKEVQGVQGVSFKKFPNVNMAENFIRKSQGKFSPPLSPNTRDKRTKLFLQHNSEAILRRQQEMKPTMVFCDGSFIPSKNGGRDKAGFGVYFGPGDPRNISAPLKDGPKNSFISEARAIDYVLRNVLKDIEKYKRDQIETIPKYSISSDSETMKNILHAYSEFWTDKDYAKKKDVPDLKNIVDNFKKVRKFYKENGHIFDDHDFRITWVKGHVGIEGNEEADRLAREGAELSVL